MSDFDRPLVFGGTGTGSLNMSTLSAAVSEPIGNASVPETAAPPPLDQNISAPATVGAPSAPVADASVDALLAALKLDQYAAVFARSGVDDLDALRALSRADYEQLGVLIGHRAKIMARLGISPSEAAAAPAAVAPAAVAPRVLSQACQQLASELLSGRFPLNLLEHRYGGEALCTPLWQELRADALQHSEEATCQCVLGVCYDFGRGGVEVDFARAAEWYQRASDAGLAQAQFSLADCYLNGKGVALDRARAAQLLQLAAAQFHPSAQCDLGHCYLGGTGVDKDAAAAVRCFELAAKQGHASAQYNLGCCLLNGTGTTRDARAAVALFQLAADQGDGRATYSLYTCYRDGTGVVQSEAYAKQLLAERGKRTLMLSERDVRRTMQVRHLAAEGGDSDALVALAACYWAGISVPRDNERALKLCQRAADAGHAQAQYELGRCYALGTRGITTNSSLARDWYQKAAAQGHAEAALALEHLDSSCALM